MIQINNDLKTLIENNALGFATVGGDGNPHVIAVGCVKVVSDNQILITDDYIVETTKNIRQNPNVALAVWSRNWEENCIGYELKGTAEYFTEGKWYDIMKQNLETAGEPQKGAIVITINKIKGLAS
jgi:predicted pyridoxine 5'-phosphate oxidase superfamily flavin-nucleotide-binding protein